MITNMLGLVSARLASPLASFLIIVLVARMWGQEFLGKYNTVWVWLSIFLYASLFGIGEFISKEAGANRDTAAKYLVHGLLLGFMSSLFCGLVMAGGGILFNYPDDVEYGIITATLALPFSALTLICIGLLTAFQKIKHIGLISVLEGLLFLLIGSVIIGKGYGLITLIWCLVIVRLLGSALSIYIVHTRVTRLRFEIDWKFFGRLLAPVVAFGLTTLASIIFLRIDVVMLSKMKDMATVGLYSSANKLMDIALMLPLAFYGLILPVTARMYKDFRETAHHQIETYTRQLFVLVFLEFGLAFFFAERILSLVYGDSFVEATGVLRILMLALLVITAEMILVMFCQATGYHKVAMYFAIGRAVTNVALNFVLIPIWGGLGAALATLLSISIVFATLQYFVRKTFGSFHWIRMIRGPALACGLTMLLISPLADRMNTLLLGSLFLFGYALLLLTLNGFSFDRLKSV